MCALLSQGCSVCLHPAGLHSEEGRGSGWTSQNHQSAGSPHEPDKKVWVKQPFWVYCPKHQSWRTVADVRLCPTVLRLGNSVEALEAAKRAIHLSDSVLRLCLTISHLNKAMYFACDNVLWAGKTGLISKLDQQKWSQRSFRWVFFLFTHAVNFKKWIQCSDLNWALSLNQWWNVNKHSYWMYST